MKKILGSIVAVALLATSLPASGAQWALDDKFLENSAGINLVNDYVTAHNTSRLRSLITTKFDKTLPEEVLCEGFGSGDCDFNEHHASGVLLLPACTDSITESCVLSLKTTWNQEVLDISFIRQAAGLLVKADPKRGLPQGSTVSLWEGKSKQTGLTQKFAVYAFLNINGFKNDKFQLGDLGVTVMPYSEKTGSNYFAPNLQAMVSSEGRRSLSIGGGHPGCAFTETGFCGEIEDFPQNSEVSVSVIAPSAIGGWFRGRMQDTAISVAAKGKDANQITVTGKPAEVAMIGFAKPISETPASFINAMKKSFPWWTRGTLSMSNTGNFESDLLQGIRDALEDTASGIVSVWSFVAAGNSYHPCFQDTSKVLGIVTTNASIYQPSAPQYAKGFLNYEVSGMHYRPGGTEEFQGTYDLVMRSEVARCLYGLNKAPVSATISVSGEGDKNIATTVVSEKNGWLKLAAYGFTFSEKTIKVKLGQKKQTTITCIAPGKKTKKVTAAKPKCPKGFKRK
jgi:hypothetical protein